MTGTFGDDGCIHLLDAVRDNRSIACLHLVGEAVSFACTHALCSLMSRNTVLTRIRVVFSTAPQAAELSLLKSSLLKNTTLLQASFSQHSLDNFVQPIVQVIFLRIATVSSRHLIF